MHLWRRLCARCARCTRCTWCRLRVFNDVLLFFFFLLIIIVVESETFGYLFVSLNVMRQFFANLFFVEGTIEGREEEHDNLRTHTNEQHKVAARQVGQFEQGTQNYD